MTIAPGGEPMDSLSAFSGSSPAAVEAFVQGDKGPSGLGAEGAITCTILAEANGRLPPPAEMTDKRPAKCFAWVLLSTILAYWAFCVLYWFSTVCVRRAQ
jgi:hypothetical protein